MRSKILAWGMTFPLAVTGALAYTSQANAALLFTPGDQFNFNVTLQLNGYIDPALGGNPNNPYDVDGAGSGGDANPTAAVDLARYGSTNGAADVLFAPTVPTGDAAARTLTDRILNNSGAAAGVILTQVAGSSVDAEIGELGELRSSAGNSGGFMDIANNTLGDIRNFDVFNLFSGTAAATATAAISDGTYKYFFGLTSFTVTDTPSDIPPPGTSGTNPSGVYDFVGFGKVRKETLGGVLVDEAPFKIDASAVGLFDNGTGSDAPGCGGAAPFGCSDFITGLGPNALALQVTIETVPEPASIIGTLGAAGLGLLSTRKKNKNV
jgi:hypothetical protein